MKTIIATGLFLIATISIASAQDTVTVTTTKDLQCTWIPSAKLMVCTKR